MAADEVLPDFSRSALEWDVDNGVAYECVRGDVFFVSVRDPRDSSRGFTFSLTLSDGEYPNRMSGLLNRRQLAG